MGDEALSRPHWDFVCPQCGWSGQFETRFPIWCLACTYGAEAGAAAKDPGRRARRRKAVAQKRSLRLYAQVESAETLRTTGLLRASVIGFAVLIHMITSGFSSSESIGSRSCTLPPVCCSDCWRSISPSRCGPDS